VIAPLDLADTVLLGSPAHAVHSSVRDLVRLTREFMSPTLVSASTMDEATTVQFPELAGVVPGVGRFDPNPWGLGFEIKGSKTGHWLGSETSPSTFGHFGGSGSFLWVDPTHGVGAVCLTDREFDDWAMDVWPAFNDVVIRRYGAGRSGR
jgi:CubicO group peptidase (beta-lactamase class C family)